MDPYTDDKYINDFLKRLIEANPQELQECMSDSILFEKIGAVSKGVGLSDESSEMVKYEFLLSLLLLTSLDDFEAELVLRYDLSLKQTELIVDTIKSHLSFGCLDIIEKEFENYVRENEERDALLEEAETLTPSTRPQAIDTSDEEVHLRAIPTTTTEPQQATEVPASLPIAADATTQTPLTEEQVLKSLNIQKDVGEGIATREGNKVAPIPRYAKPLTPQSGDNPQNN